MRTIWIILYFLWVSVALAYGQQSADIIGTAPGKNFTSASLSPGGQKLFTEQKTEVANLRGQLLAKMLKEVLLDAESRVTSIAPEKLLASAASKAAVPTAAELQKIYSANSAAVGGRSFEEVREELNRYVKQSREEAAISSYIDSLKTKHKAVPGKDVNAAPLKPADVLVAVGARTITAGEFEAKNKAALNDFERNIYEDLKADLKASMLSVLIAEEAKALGVETGSIYAAEVSDKLKTYTEQEKFDLETALQKRLFAKYRAAILLKEPEPFAQPISVDDDPAAGPAAAPVTIVMFSDFQCPACAAAHPLLKAVMAEYPGKARLVVRDYPLTTIHANAFRAALAANAAKAQGKFFEYAEILYKHQGELDDASLSKYAVDLGLNLKQFELDLNDVKTAAEVRKDMADAAVYGVSWTPTIYINGIKLMRAASGDMREAIDRALGK